MAACRIARLEAPGEEVAGVKGDAKKVGGDKAKLRGADPDDANDRAVDGGHDPALPQFLANEHRSGDGQHTRDVVQTKIVQHFGFSRARVRAYHQRIERMALLPGLRISFSSWLSKLPRRCDCTRSAGLFKDARTLRVQTIAFMPQSRSAIVRPFLGLAREFHFFFRRLQILILVWITSRKKKVETKTGSGEVECRQSETECFSSERLEDEIETKRPEVAARLDAWGYGESKFIACTPSCYSLRFRLPT